MSHKITTTELERLDIEYENEKCNGNSRYVTLKIGPIEMRGLTTTDIAGVFNIELRSHVPAVLECLRDNIKTYIEEPSTES